LEFCPRCGKRLVPQKRESGAFIVCRRCGYEKSAEGPVRLVRKLVHRPKEDVIVVDSKQESKLLPKTTGVECPACGNSEALWWTVQTRSADEGSTQFFRCTKCGHTWREYG